MKLMTMLMAASAMTGAAYAQTTETTRDSGMYAGVGYTGIWTDVGASDTAYLGAISGKLGFAFNRNFAVEAEAGFGVISQEVDFGTFSFDYKLKHSIGAFAVGRLPISPAFDLVGRVGYVQAEIEAEGLGVAVSADDSGAAFGAGVEFKAANGFATRFEYTRYEFEDGADSLGVTLIGRF